MYCRTLEEGEITGYVARKVSCLVSYIRFCLYNAAQFKRNNS